jgi:hypothetical protein
MGKDIIKVIKFIVAFFGMLIYLIISAIAFTMVFTLNLSNLSEFSKKDNLFFIGFFGVILFVSITLVFWGMDKFSKWLYYFPFLYFPLSSLIFVLINIPNLIGILGSTLLALTISILVFLSIFFYYKKS